MSMLESAQKRHEILCAIWNAAVDDVRQIESLTNREERPLIGQVIRLSRELSRLEAEIDTLVRTRAGRRPGANACDELRERDGLARLFTENIDA